MTGHGILMAMPVPGEITCPICNATPGVPCTIRDASGKLISRIESVHHLERIRAAKKASR